MKLALKAQQIASYFEDEDGHLYRYLEGDWRVRNTYNDGITYHWESIALDDVCQALDAERERTMRELFDARGACVSSSRRTSANQ